MTTQAMLHQGVFVTEHTQVQSTPQQAVRAAFALVNWRFLAKPSELRYLNPFELKCLLIEASGLIGGLKPWLPMQEQFPYHNFTGKPLPNYNEANSAIDYYFEFRNWGTWAELVDGLIEQQPMNLRCLRLLRPKAKMLQTLWERRVALSDFDRDFAADIATYLEAELMATFRQTHFRNATNFATALVSLVDMGYPIAEILPIGMAKSGSADYLLRLILVLFATDSERGVDLKFSKHVQVNMRSIPRSWRKELVAKLATFNNQRNLDQIITRQKLWRRALSRVHPYEFASSAVLPVLDIIFDNARHRTLNSQVEAAIDKNKVEHVVSLLADNPGVFIRRLEQLMRLATYRRTHGWQSKATAVEEGIYQLGPQVRLSTLLSAYNRITSKDHKWRVVEIADMQHFRQEKTRRIDPEHYSRVLVALEYSIIERLKLAPSPAEIDPLFAHAVPTNCCAPVLLGTRHFAAMHHGISAGEQFRFVPDNRNNILRFSCQWYNADLGLKMIVTDQHFERGLASVDRYSAVIYPPRQFADIVAGEESFSATTQAYSHIDVWLPAGGKWVDVGDDNQLRKSITSVLPQARYLIPLICSGRGESFSAIENSVAITLGAGRAQSVEAKCAVQAQIYNGAGWNVPFIYDLHTDTLTWLDLALGGWDFSTDRVSRRVFTTVQAALLKLEQQLSVGVVFDWWARAHGVSSDPAVGYPDAQLIAQRLLAEC